MPKTFPILNKHQDKSGIRYVEEEMIHFSGKLKIQIVPDINYNPAKCMIKINTFKCNGKIEGGVQSHSYNKTARYTFI